MKHFFIVIFVALSLLILSGVNNCFALSPQTTTSVNKQQPRHGTVNRDGVAGAVSKEADKLFTQYANNNDTKGIELMLLKGQLVYLPKGKRVTLIEYGFTTHKIRTENGQILYVAREHITLDK